jgi:hypothetical protein
MIPAQYDLDRELEALALPEPMSVTEKKRGSIRLSSRVRLILRRLRRYG